MDGPSPCAKDQVTTGSEVRWIADKFHDLGPAEVFPGGQSQEMVDLKHDHFPRFVRTPAFSVRGLVSGPHTRCIVSRSRLALVVDTVHVHSP